LKNDNIKRYKVVIKQFISTFCIMDQRLNIISNLKIIVGEAKANIKNVNNINYINN